MDYEDLESKKFYEKIWGLIGPKIINGTIVSDIRETDSFLNALVNVIADIIVGFSEKNGVDIKEMQNAVEDSLNRTVNFKCIKIVK